MKSSSAKPTLNERPIPVNHLDGPDKGQPLEPLERLYEGQWVRCARYTEGHRVARNLTEAICGRSVDPADHAWVVVELRKTGRCAECGSGEDNTTYPEPDAYEVWAASKAPRLPVSREGRQAALLVEAKVALLRRELGAKEL